MAGKTNNIVRFSSLFTPEHIICQTDMTDRDKILSKLLEKLAMVKGIGNVEEAYNAVIERENEIPTVVGPGIAMPHARLEAVSQITVGIATSKEGINYAATVKGQVKLIILTLVPKTAPGAYLQAMSSLAKICQDPETANTVSGLEKPEDIWRFFDRGGVVLSEYLHACDIMNPVTVKLQEYDTLERAIDLFVRHRVRDVPVVDGEGDFIGVVTTHELLRVCLPDYILWVEDLTPIINFEPFAEILRKESNTWLAEIMTDEYAIVSEKAPAAQVVKEMARRHVDHAYVLRDKRLIGVVSLAVFLDKILRE
ncbi:MAG: PTS sugar transporter subunit IIA, partial [Sedimentisphaerales bacterium]|nr:PTS sugar transporter subunit IIA [Sedimentisphaerales bacterium]